MNRESKIQNFLSFCSGWIQTKLANWARHTDMWIIFLFTLSIFEMKIRYFVIFLIHTFTFQFMKWGLDIFILINTFTFWPLQHFIVVQFQGMLANWARRTDGWINLFKLNPLPDAGLKRMQWCTNKYIWGIFWIGFLDTKFHELSIHPHLGQMYWYLI